jgi:Flp pilus assembly protein TadG
VRRLRGDRAFVGGAEAMIFGVLVFVLGSLLVVSLWATVAAKIAVTAAAHEAARAFVEAPDDASAHRDADRAAVNVLEAHHRQLAGPIEISGAFVRCAQVTVTVRAELPAVSLGWLGGLGRRTVTARTSEVVDPYRSAADLPEGRGCG